jgi:polyisoprenoid-binding protein YceI
MSTLPATLTLTGAYRLDPAHSRIGFVARHAMITKVRGSFSDFEGSGYFDAEDPMRSSLQVTIRADSIDTRHGDRDTHVRSTDFLDVDAYPHVTFNSTAVVKVRDATYRVTGHLTIKGVTKAISIDLHYTGAAVDPFGDQRIGFEGTVVINRKDWGVSWNAALEAGGVLVSEKVTIELEVSAIRATDAA